MNSKPQWQCTAHRIAARPRRAAQARDAALSNLSGAQADFTLHNTLSSSPFTSLQDLFELQTTLHAQLPLQPFLLTLWGRATF
eukprot:6207157-Pleurochrysis_carterae.AAC.1